MLFDRKEKEVDQLFLDHFEKVAEALQHLKTLVINYLKSDKEFKDESLMVHTSEQEADLVKQKIEAKLYEGAFLPINRGDYIMLAEFIDRIANQAETTANLIVLTRPEIPDFIQNNLVNLLEEAIAAFEAFKGALKPLHKDTKTIKAAIREVIKFETRADELEWETIKQVFKSNLELARKLHLRELIEDIAIISDLTEDAAERLGIMTVKRPL